jgi:hypothetical protein
LREVTDESHDYDQQPEKRRQYQKSTNEGIQKNADDTKKELGKGKKKYQSE